MGAIQLLEDGDTAPVGDRGVQHLRPFSLQGQYTDACLRERRIVWTDDPDAHAVVPLELDLRGRVAGANAAPRDRQVVPWSAHLEFVLVRQEEREAESS